MKLYELYQKEVLKETEKLLKYRETILAKVDPEAGLSDTNKELVREALRVSNKLKDMQETSKLLEELNV